MATDPARATVVLRRQLLPSRWSMRHPPPITPESA